MQKATPQYFLTTSLFAVLPLMLLAQAPVVNTFVNKEDILIGEQIECKIVATFPENIFNVNWFTLADSVAHFEVVDKSKIDTANENGKSILSQTITLTSFDSGRWSLPALPVGFTAAKNTTTKNVFTDTLLINVGYAKADTTAALRDIKPIMDVTIKNYLWYYIAGGILLALVIAVLVWRYLKNSKKKPVPIFNTKLSDYEEAMQAIEKLKTISLQQVDDIKMYHAELTDIFKRYLSRKLQLNILTKTTSDVLMHLSSNGTSNQVITDAAAALRTADVVKFAKYLPPLAESNECLQKIKSIITTIHNSKNGI
jgi:hypothetical protein